MAKILVEVCIISARGLRHSVSLWKQQWFAVGWVDPNNKYCTRIDATGNPNPSWKTKFSTLVDNSDPNFADFALHVEVYSREPIFLREKLQGTATVALKEFLDKYAGNQGGAERETKEAGSFQLRKQNSNKPQGFVDISIRVTEEIESQNSLLGGGEGFQLRNHGSGISLPSADYSAHVYPPNLQPLAPKDGTVNHSQTNLPCTHPFPYSTNYSNPALAGRPNYPSVGGSSSSYPPPRTPLVSGPSSSYAPPRTPPPLPPPSNVGYIPTFIPRTGPLPPHQTCVNLPTGGGRNNASGPGFGMGVGVGALAAGAMIFGDDFVSGFNYPAGLQDASLTISTYPPF